MNWEKSSNYNRQCSYQARLDKVVERQKIRLRDNLIQITGIPEDVLIIHKKTTSTGDDASTVIKGNKIVNCIFPPLKDVPIRKVVTEFGEGYILTNIVSSYGEGNEKGVGKEQKDITTIDVTFPVGADINVGDMLVRVFVQETVQQNTVMVFDVIDIMASFSNNVALTMKAKVALSTRPIDLNKPLYKLICRMAERRVAVNY